MSRRARRCSTPASAPPGSRRPASACARAGCRPTACRSSPSATARSSAPCACGTSRPARPPGPAARAARGRSAAQSLGLGGEAHARGAAARAHASATRRCCWSATRPITSASASRRRRPAALWLPGPYERDRFLALELEAGALDNARGLVSATGALRAEARSRRPRRRCRAGCAGGPSPGCSKATYPSEGCKRAALGLGSTKVMAAAISM